MVDEIKCPNENGRREAQPQVLAASRREARELGMVLSDDEEDGNVVMPAPMMASILFVTWRTLDGPFSAVSRPTIARLDAFFSIFQNLHVVRSFAPLETQFFAKNRLFFLQSLLFIAVKPDFMTNFDEISSK